MQNTSAFVSGFKIDRELKKDMHTYIYTHNHTYIHTYLYTHIHTYILIPIPSVY